MFARSVEVDAVDPSRLMEETGHEERVSSGYMVRGRWSTCQRGWHAHPGRSQNIHMAWWWDESDAVPGGEPQTMWRSAAMVLLRCDSVRMVGYKLDIGVRSLGCLSISSTCHVK